MDTDLIVAVKNNNLERVRSLVEQGVDKDQGDNDDQTPLYWASFYGHLDVSKYLVEQGASLDKANKYDFTPLSCAANQKQLDVCRYLLQQGADRDKADNNGNTPLHGAAFMGHLEIAMLLMSYGADLNARNNNDQLPIDMEGYCITQEIKQAIRDEPRRRMDEAPGKRATEEDRHPNTATSSASIQHENEELEEPSNKCQSLDEEGAIAVVREETKVVAEEDEDSEPSDEEDDNEGMNSLIKK